MSDEANNTGSEQVTAPAQATTDTATSAEFNFKDHISEDLRNHASLTDIKDIDGLVKSYVNAESMIGKSIRVPNEDTSTEGKQEFYDKLTGVEGIVRLPTEGNAEEQTQFFNRLGRPEKVEDYKLPEGMTIDGNSDLVNAAHKVGLTNEQLTGLATTMAQRSADEYEVLQSLNTKTVDTLKETFGTDFDNRVKGADAALAIYAAKHPEAAKELQELSATNPIITMVLSDHAQALNEKGHEGMKAANNYGMTPTEAKERISEIQNTRGHAYWNDSDPGHEAANLKMQKLYKVVYPN